MQAAPSPQIRNKNIASSAVPAKKRRRRCLFRGLKARPDTCAAAKPQAAIRKPVNTKDAPPPRADTPPRFPSDGGPAAAPAFQSPGSHSAPMTPPAPELPQAAFAAARVRGGAKPKGMCAGGRGRLRNMCRVRSGGRCAGSSAYFYPGFPAGQIARLGAICDMRCSRACAGRKIRQILHNIACYLFIYL